MDPNSIKLENVSKLFEYEKFSRDLDSIDDINNLRDIAKCYFKLYLRQQEVLVNF